MVEKYILKTKRLGLRNWKDEDIIPFNELCQDPEVMRYFPKLATLEETTAMIARFKKHYEEHSYTYFAAETLHNQEFIGFIGLAWQDWESDYTPNADIGWRLKQSAWGKGYATEGAIACLKFARETIKLETVISIATETNMPSINVMKKIGMKYVSKFNHPKLIETPHLNPCVTYITK